MIKQLTGRFELFNTDNFELGHQCRDPKSQDSLVALASVRGLKNHDMRLTAVLPARISECVTISCLRLFEIPSETLGLYTTTISSIPLLFHTLYCLQAEAFLLTV